MTASISRPSLAALLAALLCVGAFGPTAHAQERDKAAAEALFDEGRKLMAAGNFGAACVKLEASQALDAGVGTQLNLADCYEKLGKVASAWAQFRETITAAHNAGSIERERVAKQRAEALEPQLSYLTVHAANEPGLTLTRDTTRLDAAALGSALPVDPGSYVIAAVAPGKLRWSTTVTVGPAGARVNVNVPELELEPEAPLVAAAPAPPAPQLTAASPAPSNTQKLIGIITTGSGVAALAIGGFFGLQAAGRWSDAKAKCDPYPYCGENGQRLAKDAQSSGTISTITFIAGGALLAGGLVLWLSAPGPARATETALLVGPGAVQLRGSFQ
jgi:serine/threonine-protein kinase